MIDYAIYTLDPEGRITSRDVGAARMEGYAECEIVGQHFSLFYTREERAAGIPGRALATARREGRCVAESWRVRKDGTQFWASVVIDAILDGPALVGFAQITRDLTERREAEQRLEHSHALLAQSQKLDAVGQLTAGIAHDFNNLLTGIGGSLELLAARLAADRTAGLERLIAAAQENTRRAATLTHGLLAFSRRQTLDPKALAVNGLLERMQPLIRRTAGPGIETVIQARPDLWRTRCDAEQLESAVLNLCINAREAMPRGGSLLLRTENVVLDGRAAADLELAAREYVSLAVTDSGQGMSSEVASRAFDPFFTTKPGGSGTGLGLSMVYGFARQSGGGVRIATALGAGTTVEVLLARDAASVAPPAPQPAAGPIEADPRQQVLIVDDEPTVRMLIRDVLHELGHQPLEAGNGDAALAVLREAGPLDLLITDVGLPGMNGRQLATAARALQPELKVLFITGYAEHKVLDPQQMEPGMHLLTKPFALSLLMERIAVLLAA